MSWIILMYYLEVIKMVFQAIYFHGLGHILRPAIVPNTTMWNCTYMLYSNNSLLLFLA